MPSLAAPQGSDYSWLKLLAQAKGRGQHPQLQKSPAWRKAYLHSISVLLIAAFTGLCSISLNANTPDTHSDSAAVKLTLAPDFSLQSTNGATVTLSHFKGRVVLVNFWASWCPPCRTEMPMLDNLAKSYKAAGLVVLGLNVDVDNEARDDYLKEHPVSFPILDDSKWSTAKLYIAPSQPVTFFIDRDGNLAHVHKGYKAGDDLVYTTKVNELLAK